MFRITSKCCTASRSCPETYVESSTVKDFAVNGLLVFAPSPNPSRVKVPFIPINRLLCLEGKVLRLAAGTLRANNFHPHVLDVHQPQLHGSMLPNPCFASRCCNTAKTHELRSCMAAKVHICEINLAAHSIQQLSCAELNKRQPVHEG